MFEGREAPVRGDPARAGPKEMNGPGCRTNGAPLAPVELLRGKLAAQVLQVKQVAGGFELVPGARAVGDVMRQVVAEVARLAHRFQV